MEMNNSIFDGITISELIKKIINEKFGQNDTIEHEGNSYGKESYMEYLLSNLKNTIGEYFKADLLSDLNEQKKHYNYLMSARKRRISSKLNKTLSLVKSVILKSSEVGESIHNTIIISQSDTAATIPNEEMVKFVLLKIHSRAMEVCGEILNLLENGFVLGALARWRSLFEYTVIAQILIDLNDYEVAVMYLKHDTVSYFKAVNDLYQYAKHKTPDFDEIHKDYKELISNYGESYKDNYGWYKPKQGIDFISLAKKHNMTTLLGYFRESNMPNHGSSFRIFDGNQDIKEKINSYEIPIQNLILSIGTLNQSILQYFMGVQKEPTLGFVTLMNFFSTAIEEVTKTFFEERKRVDSEKPSIDEF